MSSVHRAAIHPEGDKSLQRLQRAILVAAALLALAALIAHHPVLSAVIVLVALMGWGAAGRGAVSSSGAAHSQRSVDGGCIRGRDHSAQPSTRGGIVLDGGSHKQGKA